MELFMKLFFVVLVSIASQLSFANDLKSDQMVELLLKSRVESFGKKGVLTADVGCKITEKIMTNKHPRTFNHKNAINS